MLTKIVGEMTVEKEWLEKNLKSLGLSDKKQLIEPKLYALSVPQQCTLLGLNRSSLYYQNKENLKKKDIKAHINQVFEEILFMEQLKYISNCLKMALKLV